MNKFLAWIIPMEQGAHPDHGLPPFPSHPIVIPPDAIAPGVPTHPIYIPPPYPDNTLPGPQPHPDHELPGSQPRPDQGLPPFPSHPVWTPPGGWQPVDPPHPDNTLPGSQPRPDQGLPPFPSQPIVIPPLPPKPPVVLPPGEAEGGRILLLPLDDYVDDVPPSVPANSTPYLAVKPGYMPVVVWVPPMGQPKKTITAKK